MPASKKAPDQEPTLGQVEADTYERLNAEPETPAKQPESEDSR